MLSTFIDPQPIERNIVLKGSINLLPRLETNISKAVGWYRKSSFFVKNEHILGKVIRVLLPDIDLPLTGFRSYVERKKLSGLIGYGFTTYTERGLPLDGEIREDSTEFIKIVNSRVDMFKVKSTWRELSPLKVVSHNLLDINLTHPDNSIDSGVIYYTLDPVELLLQYRFWYIERKEKLQSTYIGEFLFSYVLTNSMISYYQASMLNIMLTPVFDISFINYNPFYLKDLTKEFKALHKDFNKLFRNVVTSSSFENILHNIKLYNNVTGLGFLQVNDFTDRSNNKWFHWLSHLDISILLLELLDNKQGDANGKIKVNAKNIYNVDVRRRVFGHLSKDDLIKLDIFNRLLEV